jgi:hypothetical protein
LIVVVINIIRIEDHFFFLCVFILEGVEEGVMKLTIKIKATMKMTTNNIFTLVSIFLLVFFLPTDYSLIWFPFWSINIDPVFFILTGFSHCYLFNSGPVLNVYLVCLLWVSVLTLTVIVAYLLVFAFDEVLSFILSFLSDSGFLFSSYCGSF